MRKSHGERNTKETQIKIAVNLDGIGESSIETPYGFLNHMLELLAKHSGIDMDIKATGDTEVDEHHTVEDIAIVLGEELNKALAERVGIERYASVMMVMDEVRVDVALDLGGRSNLVYHVSFSGYDKEHEFDYSMIKEFMKALSDNLKVTIHIYHKTDGQISSSEVNKHHVAEAIFKGLARALKQAVKITGTDIPSTKGVI